MVQDFTLRRFFSHLEDAILFFLLYVKHNVW